ncbi:hypothetical protein D9613_004025 [Agrocybe pediades]|uniref:ER membrane protein complex subunit 1 n=1 Tax=Agrocybe pediades TaxID=84607 RepID=A0A8H4QJA3_9AGAR|nr:hypothetical protein D9613_004025 [Agrocybe pediades]
MRFFTTVVAVLSSVSLYVGTTWALHESDVGVVDWHKHMVGIPLSGSISTSPSFHLVNGKNIILTATTNNVLAALEPEDGSIIWRYIFDPEDRIAGYYKNATTVATLSGPGGAILRNFNALTGELLLEKRLHKPEIGALSEPLHLGKDVVFAPHSNQMYVLSNGCTISCIDGSTGEVIWSWTSPDQGSMVIHAKLTLSQSTLFATGFAKSTASFTLHATSLSLPTGELNTFVNIPSALADPLHQFILLTRPDLEKPIAIWLEQGAFRYVALTPDLLEKPRSVKGEGFARLVDIGLSEFGYAVVLRNDESSFVMRLEGMVGQAKPVWEFDDSKASEANADSRYAGVLDAHGRAHVSRVYWSHHHEKGAFDVFTAGQPHGFSTGAKTFAFNTKDHGIIGHVAVGVPDSAPIHLITTSTGSVQLWEQETLKWEREESLAAVVIAEFVEVPERATSVAGVMEEAQEGFVARVIRQIGDAQDFPRYLVNFVKRFATGSYASPSSPPPPPPTTSNSSEPEPFSRDTFGFRQLIIAATAFGKVYAIDSSTGTIVWSRVLGLGWAGQVGGRVQPVKVFVVKGVSEGGDVEVVLVAQRRASNTLVDTVAFHVNALTGSDVLGKSPDGEVLEGQDVIEGPLVEGYLLGGEKKVIVMFDEHLQVYLYPSNPSTIDYFSSVAHKLSFPLRTTIETRKRITGHQIQLSSDHHKSLAYPTWTLTLPLGEDVQAMIPQAKSGVPVASVGKVLGNRTTLYKYLDERLFVLLTVVNTPPPPPPATGSTPEDKPQPKPSHSQKCGIYVVDGAKGTVVYHAEVKAPGTPGANGKGGGCQVKAAFSENWLVYHYYEDEVEGGSVGGSKGYRMVSVEFYEGRKGDEKIMSSELTAYSNDTLNLSTYEQAYVFPYAITALATTSTKFGITSKDLIVATNNHRVQSFARRMLDPRRPNRKTTADEQEEFLIQYDPLLPNDPRRVLSHNYDVANVQKIITSPSLLESTSLVFAFGLDMFLTRVAPSNTFDVLSENFNKVQLVLTVTGLAAAILSF